MYQRTIPPDRLPIVVNHLNQESLEKEQVFPKINSEKLTWKSEKKEKEIKNK